MPNIIFFAWQLDTPSELNKKFIWDALEQATAGSTIAAVPELSPRPEMDTQGIPGSPNIVQTIFERIRNCSVFIADLSFVATTDQDKKIPNPNVLIELGFAARSIGWDRTILVLNTAHGQAKDLPFDILQHRWPIQYRLTPKSTVSSQKCEKLSNELVVAIDNCEKYSLSRATEMVEALDTATFKFVAENENNKSIEMPLPGKTARQILGGLDYLLASRRLMELGALRVTDQPYVGYAWTYDGSRMIDEINKLHPLLLQVMRE